MAILNNIRVKGEVLTPGDTGYEESVKRWAGNAERKAGYVVFVENAEDISNTILWATKNGLELAIKGGGHSSNGASSTEGGVIIDLSHLRGVTIDAEKHLAYCQGGALWSDLDTAAADKGFADVAGTVNHTGIGGLTLGGGYGYLTGQYGLAIDNLVEATVVVADGRIVKASEKENPDLFWGIRGGGSNFGVVYEFVFRIYPHGGTCYGGLAMFSTDKVAPFAAEFHKFWKTIKADSCCNFAITALPPTLQPSLVLIPFCDTGDEPAARKRFEGFFSLGAAVDHTSLHPYVQQNAVLNPIVPHGPRSYTKSFIYQVTSISAELLNYSIDKFATYISHLGQDYEISAVIYEPFPPGKVSEIPKNGTACPLRNGIIHCVLNVRWKNESHDAWVAQWVRDFIKGAREIDQRISGGSKEFGYANMVLPGEKAAEAFGENYAKLREVKRKWDPEMRFNKWLPIQPA